MTSTKQQLEELIEKGFIFVPNTYNFLLTTLFILDKHNVKLLLPSEYMLKNNIKNFRDLFIHWNCETEDSDKKYLRKLDIPKFYSNEIKKFINRTDSNKRFLVFPLILHDKLKCSESVQTSKITHTNIIIYDKINKSLERFDPSNTINYDSSMIDTVLLDTFVNKFNLDIEKTYTPNSICPQKKGIQGMQEQEVYSNKIKIVLGGNIGFCSMYSLLYLDLRLSNIDKEPSDIIKMILKISQKKGITLTKMIVDYTYNLQKVHENIENELQNKKDIKLIYLYEEEEKRLKKEGFTQDEIDTKLLSKYGKTNGQILHNIFSSIKKYFNLKRK